VTTVRIPPTLRTETGGKPQVEAEGATVRDLLEDLSSQFPALRERLWEDGNVAPFVNVYLGGEDVRTLEGIDTPVEEGQTVILLPAMAGGATESLAGALSRPARYASGLAEAISISVGHLRRTRRWSLADRRPASESASRQKLGG
jgi:molybdopterin synthase sulfur carrier subunit